MDEKIRSAEEDWLAISTPSNRPLLGSRGAVLGEFRELLGVAIWIAWEHDAGYLKRVEATSSAMEGATEKALRELMAIALRHGATLRGNVDAYATTERPIPDNERLIAFYRRLGFEVSDTPARMLHYPPVAQLQLKR